MKKSSITSEQLRSAIKEVFPKNKKKSPLKVQLTNLSLFDAVKGLITLNLPIVGVRRKEWIYDDYIAIEQGYSNELQLFKSTHTSYELWQPLVEDVIAEDWEFKTDED